MPTRPISPLARRALVALLLALVALTQTLGLVHRTLIGHGAAPGQGEATLVSAAEGGGFLHALFAGHHDPRDCKLFDQLAHADLASGEGAVQSADLPAEVPVIAHCAWHIAAQAAGFLARGPPLPA